MEDLNNILEKEIVKVVISNKRNSNFNFNKIVIEKKDSYFQASKYEDKKVFHDNFEDLKEYVLGLVPLFKQFNIWDNTFEYQVKFSKKDKALISKSKYEGIKINTKHNKEKNYILKEGLLIEPLIDLGIFTKDGKVVNSMYDKYRQINKFIEVIESSIKEDYSSLNIIDFGCGKSYLTFILYYYFKFIKNIDVTIIGLDLKDDVINNCNEIAKKYGYSNLFFELGDINGYKPKFKVDMVISLHACDIATDYVLHNAIKWKSKFIFSVPCCQHELNSQIESDDYKIITNYGLAKERISSLFTDIIRCNLLIYSSYKTEMLEFIDLDHTPKNILIKGVLSNINDSTKKLKYDEVKRLIRAFNLDPVLYNLVNNDNSKC